VFSVDFGTFGVGIIQDFLVVLLGLFGVGIIRFSWGWYNIVFPLFWCGVGIIYFFLCFRGF